jgi:hypothetical protein
MVQYRLKKVKVKQYHYRPVQVLRVQEFEAARFADNWNMKVVSVSVLATIRLYFRIYSWYSFLFDAEPNPRK